MRICQNILRQINNTIRNCQNMSWRGGVVCTFSDVLKFDRKYVKKFDFAWGGGGQLPPPSKIWNDVPDVGVYILLKKYHRLHLNRMRTWIESKFKESKLKRLQIFFYCMRRSVVHVSQWIIYVDSFSFFSFKFRNLIRLTYYQVFNIIQEFHWIIQQCVPKYL